MTNEQAVQSCLGEAVELMSSCFWGNETIIESSSDQASQEAVAIEDLVFVSDQQYRDRADWNARLAGFAQLPTRKSAMSCRSWIEAKCLTGNRSVLVPAGYALVGYPDVSHWSHNYIGNSTGCAAASSFDEAIVAGFLELVERDAAAIWWYGKHSRSALDLSGLEKPQEISRWLVDSGRSCQVLDISTDLEVPVCAALSEWPNGSGLALGFAAHFDIRIAIEAALTELVQQALASEIQHQVRSESADPQVFIAPAELALDPELVPQTAIGWREVRCAAGAHATAESCAEICKRQGLELLVVELTRHSLGVPVVRSIVPGLRQTLPAFARGRLYDVPNRLGWPSQPVENELNRQPFVG
jgi:ribosomal protein S12 methylthiotransferase accessory factor